MGTYTGQTNVFNHSVYLFDSIDLVLGSLNGTSNIPVRQLADNTTYLKKYSGRIVTDPANVGGDPNTLSGLLTGFVLDNNSLNNIMYLDVATGSFWKLTSISPITWVNIYKTAVLNVKGINVNNNGNDADYLGLSYNSTTKSLEIRDENGNLGDITVANAYFDTLDTYNMDFNKIADNEILILSDITTPQTGTSGDGMFSVKRLVNIPEILITHFIQEDTPLVDKWFYEAQTGFNLTSVIAPDDFIQVSNIDEQTGELINGYYRVASVTGTYISTYRMFKAISADFNKTGLAGLVAYDDSAMVKWNNTQGYFELVSRKGTLLPINCSGFYINGSPVQFMADRVLTRTIHFDTLFANLEPSSTVCKLKRPETAYALPIENEYIYLRKNENTVDGSYTLNNTVEILGNNVRIECAPGVVIKYGNATAGFKTINDTRLYVSKTELDGFRVNFINTYYTESLQIGTQYVPTVGEKIFAFSNQMGNECAEYTVASSHKVLKDYSFNINTTNDVWGTYVNLPLNKTSTPTDYIDNENQTATTFFYLGVKYLVILYKNTAPVAGIKPGYSLYEYNTATEKYDYLSSNSEASGSTTYGDVLGLVAKTGSTNVHFFFNDATQSFHSVIPFADIIASANIAPSAANLANIITSDVFVVNDSDIVMSGFDSTTPSTLRVKKFITSWSDMTIPATDVSTCVKLGILKNGNDILVAVGKFNGSLHQLTFLYYNGTVWTSQVMIVTESAKITRLSILNSGSQIYHIAYDYDDLQGVKTNFITQSGSTFSLSNLRTVTSHPLAVSANVETYVTTENIFPATGVEVINVIENIGTDTIYTSTEMYSPSYSDFRTQSLVLPVNASTYQNIKAVQATNNNFMFTGFTDGRAYVFIIPYQMYINVSETTINMTSAINIVSPNVITNTNLKLNVDCQNNAVPEVISSRNSIYCNFDISFLNGVYTSIGVSGFDKTFGNIYKLRMPVDMFDHVLSKVHHSNVINSFIYTSTQTGGGAAIFECNNDNIIGFLDGVSIVGNGNFNNF